MKTCTVDYSNGANCVLSITHNRNGKSNTYLFNHSDEDAISNFISEHIGEQLHDLNGCPIYMEVAGWSACFEGSCDEEYSLNNYDIDENEWNICILVR